MGNFLHPRIIKQFDIPTKPRPKTMELQTVTGSKFFKVTQQAHVLMTTKHGHQEIIPFNVAPIGKHDLILGLPWCKYHEVQFDWHQNDIIQWSPKCKERCFPSHTLASLLVKTLCPDSVVPQRATPGSIGYDLTATETITLPPHSRCPVPTGIAIALPEGTYGRIAPRSGLSVKASINVAAGVIDPDYRGELKAVLINQAETPFTIKKGERMAQLILENAVMEDIIITDNLDTTLRDTEGFGSTGMSEELAEIYEISLGHTANANIPPQDERYRKLREKMPTQIHSAVDIFDSDLAMSTLPPSRPGYDFEITLVENAKLPPPAKPYHISHAEKGILKDWATRMNDAGLISKCTTKCPTAAPVFFVGKKDGSKRPVIDYRKLNDVTVRDAYPMPRIDQIMDQVRGSTIFSTFDMKLGYNQLRVKPGQEWLTAFNTPDGLYQTNVMTFGFMNAPAFFQ